MNRRQLLLTVAAAAVAPALPADGGNDFFVTGVTSQTMLTEATLEAAAVQIFATGVPIIRLPAGFLRRP